MTGRLEETYLIRLFAVFEAALREAWRDGYGQPTHPPVRDLLNGIAARAKRSPVALLAEVHAVREYRNAVVHGGDAVPVRFADARRRLNRFLACLPSEW